MQIDSPPIILTFGLADPTSATGVQADLLTFASMGGYGVSVLTGYSTQDSRNLDDVVAVDPDWVIDQARMLLEDMPVAAFKVGGAVNAENVAAVAEIVADYDDTPLVIAPDFSLAGEHLLSADELREATASLLAPQSSVLVASPATVIALAQATIENENPTLDEAVAALLEHGCEFVLVSDTSGPQWTHTLHSDDGVVREDAWDRPPHNIAGAVDTLAAAVAAMLANGLDMPEAVREAQEYLQQVTLNAFRPGMGRHFPDRFFWARGDEENAAGADAGGESDGKAGTAAGKTAGTA
ncbi:Hydroxymethylpyrimidine/phosphomethylpyrimidine kinase [Pandoraea terrae]|uniref:Hydroxymethylpyrimidine/phosphomethylpyrimidine kinase n=1 Tax=Pandoraea terrae TaxID=1537710 RepID=A0A5E4TS09_9BURK|nr:bifunctional hydroxymethylpyrimidine kinase/phosphomethylpyrimidine kinase [Pandoraea terrae]VVD88839.1 Hydroxymethylpyrimidine/phosphomethylpyrimidine kinase [Pandoraea terrae]